MKHKLILTLAGILFCMNLQAQSYDSGTSSARPTTDIDGDVIQRGFAGYIGAGAGYISSNEDANLEGMPTSLKLLGSYVTSESKGVFDAGYGIQNNTFSQDEALNSSTTGGIMELAGRYQFESRWQLGAVYNQLFDEGDNFNSNQADAEFAGIQLLREYSFAGQYLGRVGGRLMSSLNSDDQSVNTAAIDFQLGWGGTN